MVVGTVLYESMVTAMANQIDGYPAGGCLQIIESCDSMTVDRCFHFLNLKMMATDIFFYFSLMCLFKNFLSKFLFCKNLKHVKVSICVTQT